jgi:REP element-mobilizing transposase RayT
MGTYTQIIYQIVIGTRYREKVLTKNNREELFKFINGILQNKKCVLYQVNGVEDHIHIVTHIHPTVALASLVKDIKLACSLFIKENNLFPHFRGWQDGYGAFTYSLKEKDRLITYVQNQEEHHKRKTFLDEYKNLLETHTIKFEEKYLP